MRGIVITVLAVCTIGAGNAPAIRPSHPPEVAVFTAAVKYVAEKYAGDLAIDPRPFGVSDEPGLPSVAQYIQVAEELVQHRTRSVKAFGLPITEVLPLLPDCSVENAPPPFKVTSGCPMESDRRVAFGRPFRVGDEQRIRGILIRYYSTGVHASGFELGLRRTEAGWVVVSHRSIVAWT